MDFQYILNLMKGNLGGAGMQQVEDGSMVGGGFNGQPPMPRIQEDPLQEALKGLPLDLPDQRALQVSPPGEQYLEQPASGYHSPLTTMGRGQPAAPIQQPDFQALLRGLIGQ